MIDHATLSLTVAAAISCGLVAGVFFAFSTFVMPALRRLSAPQGVGVMQSINVTVITPLFMLALFGAAAVCAVLAVLSIVHWGEKGAGLVLAGSIAYLLGTIVTTMAYHVPRNDKLSTLDANAADTARHWRHFYPQWTTMNHVRTISSIAATICFTLALRA
jgi:uncharacterized membrane protein